jgi:succinoglycan biosynthesis protein ExoO
VTLPANEQEASGSMPAIEMQEEAEFWISPCASPSETIRATIIIPSYCAEATLLRAVRSALDQTMRNIEVIVVDDASTDSSWELISALLRADPRLRAIRNKRNCGKPIGMNRAIALARGDWLAVLDADDWYHVDRLAALVALAEARCADMAADNQVFFDGAAGKFAGTAWPQGKTDWALSFDDFLIGSNAYRTFNLGMLKPVLRTEFIRRTSLSYEQRARNGQDFFYLLQFFLSGGKAVVTDMTYYYYTQPFGAISRQWSHPARRRYDFQTAYDINQRYLAAAAPMLTPRQAARLRKRNSRLRSLEYYYQAKECLAGGDIGGAIAGVARQPAMLGYVLRRLVSYLLRHAFSEPSKRPASKVIERVAARSRRLACRHAVEASKRSG